MNIRKTLIPICALTAIVALASPAFAVLTSDNTNIGAHPSYGSSYSAFWRTGSDYSMITDGTHTWVSAPSSGGAIMFRGNNTASPGVTSPDGASSRAFIDSQSNLVVAGGIYGNAGTTGNAAVNGQSSGIGEGVFGSNTNASGYGIYGTNTSGGTSAVAVFGEGGSGFGIKGHSTGNAGVVGISTAGFAAAVYGQTFSSTGFGLFGDGTQASAVGVLGKTNSATVAAIYAQSPSNTGLAYYGIGNITITGNTATKQSAGSWVGTSDERVKKSIRPFTEGLSELERVNPITFQYNGLGGTVADGKDYVGVKAQELETVLPSMVSVKNAKLRETDTTTTGIRQIDPSDFTYLLINSVKELNAQVIELRAQVSELKRQGATKK